MRIGLLITSYNRPSYLMQCLESIKAADLPSVVKILIVDDASTDPETIKLINEFEIKDQFIAKFIKSQNRSIKDSIFGGSEMLFAAGCDYVVNLDGDAIVRKDFLIKLIDLAIEFPLHIVTGFNCLTKNKNGTERHKILEEGNGWNKKASVGGINMCYDEVTYCEYIRPALLKSIKEHLNWDHQACLNSEAAGKPIICCVPSVCQHIGSISSMGHSSGGEPMDVADDFVADGAEIISRYPIPNIEEFTEIYRHSVLIEVKPGFKGRLRKIHLPQITLVGADCVDIERLIDAADKSCEGIEFGAVKLFSSLESDDPRVYRIRHLGSKEDYSWFIMKEMVHYIDTEYILIIQHDGYIIDPMKWRPEWLQYDLIGAVWEWYPEDGRTRVGNGGLSVRSKRLMEIVKKDNSIYPMNEHGINHHCEEDHVICRIFGKYLQDNYGIKFAPEDEARKFSIEAWRNPDPVYRGQFGFHGGGIIGVNK
jgi:glycosyltransferase involved in cell wall biosynthesis